MRKSTNTQLHCLRSWIASRRFHRALTQRCKMRCRANAITHPREKIWIQCVPSWCLRFDEFSCGPDEDRKTKTATYSASNNTCCRFHRLSSFPPFFFSSLFLHRSLRSNRASHRNNLKPFPTESSSQLDVYLSIHCTVIKRAITRFMFFQVNVWFILRICRKTLNIRTQSYRIKQYVSFTLFLHHTNRERIHSCHTWKEKEKQILFNGM